jgi:sarcosine oxidase, subunit gamma
MGESRSPLAHRADDLARLHAVEVPLLPQIDVRCGPHDAVRLGFSLRPNVVAGDMTRGALWLGPDEWLVVGLPGAAPAILRELEAALAYTHHSVVDVSAGRAVIQLTGVERHRLLGSGCSLDLDAHGGWLPGVCAQTLFARAPVLLQELVNATRIFVRPSFAEYVVDRVLAAGEMRS